MLQPTCVLAHLPTSSPQWHEATAGPATAPPYPWTLSFSFSDSWGQLCVFSSMMKGPCFWKTATPARLQATGTDTVSNLSCEFHKAPGHFTGSSLSLLSLSLHPSFLPYCLLCGLRALTSVVEIANAKTVQRPLN